MMQIAIVAASQMSVPMLLTVLLISSAVAATADSGDAEALLTFKSSLTAGQDALSNWRNDASDPCTWVHVTCNGSGRVSQLNVTGLGLAGPLPNNLTTFTALRSLDASNNQLSGPLPTAWGSDMGLQALESINLANNLIQGTLPDSWAQTGALTVLQQLILDSNKLAGSLPLSWGAAGSVPALRLLSLRNNAFAGQLPVTWCNGVESLPALKALFLDKNLLRDVLPGWFGTGCLKLKLVSLVDNKFIGGLPAAWAGQGHWPALQVLFLQSNSLTGSFPAAWTAPSAFLSMQRNTTLIHGMVLKPGNKGLIGPVPSGIQFPVLAQNTATGQSYLPITSLADGITSALPPVGPSLIPAAGTISGPALIPAAGGSLGPALIPAKTIPTAHNVVVLRLLGPGLWPFSSQQAAILQNVVFNTLNATYGLQSATDVVVGTATEVIESGPRQRLMRRLLAAPSVGVEVPVYVAISPDQAGALADTLRSAVAAGSVAQLLTQQGLPVSSVLLVSTLLNPGNIPSTSLTNSAAVTIPLIDPNGAALQLTADGWPVPAGVASTSVSVIVGATIGALAGLAVIGVVVFMLNGRQRRKLESISCDRIVEPKLEATRSFQSSITPAEQYQKANMSSNGEASYLSPGSGSTRGPPSAADGVSSRIDQWMLKKQGSGADFQAGHIHLDADLPRSKVQRRR